MEASSSALRKACGQVHRAGGIGLCLLNVDLIEGGTIRTHEQEAALVDASGRLRRTTRNLKAVVADAWRRPTDPDHPDGTVVACLITSTVTVRTGPDSDGCWATTTEWFCDAMKSPHIPPPLRSGTHLAIKALGVALEAGHRALANAPLPP